MGRLLEARLQKLLPKNGIELQNQMHPSRPFPVPTLRPMRASLADIQIPVTIALALYLFSASLVAPSPFNTF
jgi:hypothetical protein